MLYAGITMQQYFQTVVRIVNRMYYAKTHRNPCALHSVKANLYSVLQPALPLSSSEIY
jgi:hypothetical protein